MTTLATVLICGAAFCFGYATACAHFGYKFTKLSKTLANLAWFEENGTKAQKYNDGVWTLWSGNQWSSEKCILKAAYWLRKAKEL